VSTEQAYLRNTAILETTLTDKDGNRLRIRDFAPRFKRAGRIFRPVAVTRIIEPLSGSPRVTVNVDPLHDYGAQVPETTRGSSHVRFLLGDQVLRLTTDAPVDFVLRRTPFVVDRTYS
ncbi:glycoside hydrolase family 15 protein, partial [Rhizobiaceae sp. 2RAB30]